MKQFDPEKNRIEEVKKVLFSKKELPLQASPKPLPAHQQEVPVSWEDEKVFEQQVMKQRMSQTRRSVVKAFFFAATAFFIFAISFAGYIFYHDANTVSANNVDIKVAAPVSIAGGEELSLQITLDNKNNIDLSGASLIVSFPEGTRDAIDREKEVARVRDDIGTIPAGGSVTRQVKAVLFGEERTIKKIAVSLEYRVRGSNAIFQKDKEVEVELSTAPVSLSVSIPQEVSVDQEFEIVSTIISNSTTVVKDALVEVEYPFGFKFTSANPPSLPSSNAWQLGDLAPGEKKIVRIRGSLTGQNEDERAFRFTVGTAHRTDPKRVGTRLLSYVQTLSIKRSFIGMEIELDGNSSSEYVVTEGKAIRVDIRWRNNLPSRVSDAVIEVTVRGNAFDRNSVVTQNGFYRSVDDVIVFDKTTSNSYALLNPGDSGTGSFTFRFISPSRAASLFLQNQEVTVEAKVRGKRVSGEEVVESLSGVVARKVKVSSSLSLLSRAAYSGTPITNSGPIPPRADHETRYTVTWSITNTFNALASVKVVAPALPGYVRWTGITYPLGENIQQGEDGSIVWDVGEVKPYTGFSSAPREVSFQIALTPSLTQIGMSPLLLQPALLSGSDRFTGASLSSTGMALTTMIATDPAFKQGDGQVVP